jgi:hypothetical protein
VALYDRLAALKAEDAAAIANAAAAKAAADAAAKQDADLRAAWAANYQTQQAAMQQAQQAADQAAEQLAQQRADKELVLYNLTHTASEQLVHQRELEMAAMDASLRPIQEMINAQQDMATAAGVAAQAIQDAATKAAAIASEGAGINRDMLQLRGDTAGLRALELAALDPANRAAKEAYYALQDKMASDQAMAQAQQAIAQAQQQAAETAAAAAKALAEAWSSADKAIMAEVAQIRGLLDPTGATSTAQAQAAFATATAQARAGDVEAAKSLPELARTLVDLAKTSAVSAFDLRLIQAQVAASLEQTAGQTGGSAAVQTSSAIYTMPQVQTTSPAPQNNAAADAQIAALQQANADILESMDRALYVIARNSGASTDILAKWDAIGIPEERAPA